MLTDFLFAAPYESRKVQRDEFEWGFISTAYVNDGAQPYETAVEHPDYNDGSMVIVEAYDSREAAEAGHLRWVAAMTANTLPETLTDVPNAEIASLVYFFSGAGANAYPRVQRGE
jgi:hypothetical protein